VLALRRRDLVPIINFLAGVYWAEIVQGLISKGYLQVNFNYSFSLIPQSIKEKLNLTLGTLVAAVRLHSPVTFEMLLQIDENEANKYRNFEDTRKRQVTFNEQENQVVKFAKTETVSTIASNEKHFKIQKVPRPRNFFWDQMIQELQMATPEYKKLNKCLRFTISDEFSTEADLSFHRKPYQHAIKIGQEIYLTIHPGWRHLIQKDKFGSLLLSDLKVEDKYSLESIAIDNKFIKTPGHFPKIYFSNYNYIIGKIWISMKDTNRHHKNYKVSNLVSYFINN